ncbi:tryptophan synthase subunit alpha [Brevundimonas vitis]|uniref:Tryptophan synthase alpha chain n=1 Tax=Brevundimonas vitisensis TaxID=2800818 RepID=A0ABX7BR53_9CAUL|nr:tryptophan synthase subunit alpha [Brevundimonas vitisensis]QQQ17985.1 tryptophan synthase subunit alpha [Brevundimonas vitisensis]
MTTARLDTCFAQTNGRDGKAVFVGYVMAGDPDLETTFQILKDFPGGIIELGLPFSDPMAEGPSIQRAAQRALAAGTTTRDVLALVRRLREVNTETPVVLMGYLNPIESYGYAAFAADAAEAGVDGLIVVDCPPEESAPLVEALEANHLSLIRLATPTSDDARLKVIAERTSGFIYYVSVAGVTGVKEAQTADVAPAVTRVRAASGLPVAVGFGIRTPERAAEIARVADAVVIGSAFVDEVAAALEANEAVAPRVLGRMQPLADAVALARQSENV